VGSGVRVTVGVGLCSNVGEGLAVAVGSGGATWPVPRNIRKIIPPPTARTINNNPSASGRLKVISGSRCERTVFDFLVAADMVKVLPQTKQRFAFSLKRVPHVGQILDGVLFSGLIL